MTVVECADPSSPQPFAAALSDALQDQSEDGATATKTFLVFLKSFIGSAILFLPSAFGKGGVGFCTVMLIVMCIWNVDSILLLFAASMATECKSYGGLARDSYGRGFQLLVDGSLCAAQIGFCAAYIVFIAQCLGQAGNWFMNCTGDDLLGGNWVVYLCLLQVPVLIPLALIQSMSRLVWAAVLADALLVLCIGYLYVFNVQHISTKGPSPTLALWVGASPSTFLGTAAYAFEGIGLVLPIASSMAEPELFPGIAVAVLAILLLLLLSFGLVGVFTFGADAQPTILLDLSLLTPGSPTASIIELLYCIILICSFPLMLFPASQILDRIVDARSRVTQDAVRICGVVVCAAIAALCTKHFDTSIALVGAFTCIPLAYIYPAVIHYKLVAREGWEIGKDVSYAALGVAMMLFIGFDAIRNIVQGEEAASIPCYRH